MNLQTALGVKPGELVALVGAGGKTTTAWRLMNLLIGSGERVLFTTTTRIFRPRALFLLLAPNPTPAEIAQRLAESPALVLAVAMGEMGDPAQAAHSPYPADPIKLVGLDAQVVNDLARKLSNVTWLVEADGAKGRLLKAPAEYEPVIPSRSDRVIVVAGLDATGKLLDKRTVHRPEIAAHLLGVSLGATVTPQLFVELIGHPAGGLKGIPTQAKVVVLLTQWNDRPASHADTVARQLSSNHRIERIVWVNLSSFNSMPKIIR